MSLLNLEADKRLPLYQRLKDALKARIIAGEWLPGDPIPAEMELKEAYGVALGTIRKAIETLVQEGFLFRVQGRGTFVRRPNFNDSFLRFFRQVSATGERGVPESRILSRTVILPSPEVARVFSLKNDEAILHLERSRLLGGGKQFYERIWLPLPQFSKLQDLPMVEFGNLLYPFYEEKCGQIIASARETLMIEPADAALSAALQMEAGKPVVVIERIASGYDGKPIEYRLSYGSADDFRYQIDIM